MSLRVRRGESLGDLDRARQGGLERQRSPTQALGERLALEQLHHQELPLDVLVQRRASNVVEHADVRMRQLRNRSRFAFEALTVIGIAGELGLQYLDRHVAAQPRVACAIDLAHPAGAERGNQLETA